MDRKSLKNKLVITLTVLVTCFFVFLNSYLSEVTEESLGQEQKITASFTANVSTAFTTYTLFLEQVLVSDKVADRYLAKIYPGLEPRCRYYNSCMLTMKDSIKQTAKSMTAYFAKKTEIQQLDFKISSKSFKEIQKTREDALENRFLSNKDYVKATLNHDGREIKVKLRLKGDRMDHLEHPKKWSFRIKTSGDDHFMGMRVFSLQNPATKAYQYEAIFHDLMRFMGVVAPRYFFVKVSINGDDIGLMAVEENFSKELLESQKRREGVIFKFNEEDFWTGWVRPVLEQKKVEDPELIRLLKNYKDFRTAQIETFQDSVIEKSEVLTTQKEIGIGLMRGVVEERLKPSEVFDAEITGKFLAIPLVFNAFHSFNWINQRYYLNPVTLKLEPISFDGNLTDVAVISELYNDKTPEGWPQTIEESFGFEFTKLLLADPAIKQATIRALQDLKSKFETTDLQNGLAKIDQQYLRVLQTEFLLLPAYAFGPLARVNETIAEINKMDLSFEVDNEELFVEIPQDLELPRIIQANIVKSGENTFLEVVNMLPTAVTLKSINAEISEKLPLDLPATSDVLRIKLKNHSKYKQIKGVVSVLRQNKDYEFETANYVETLDPRPLEPSNLKDVLLKYPFLELSATEKILKIKKGGWVINDFIILPNGLSFEVAAGTILKFGEGAGLVVNGRVVLVGGDASPITLMANDNGKYWAGITVFNANNFNSDHSKLKNVVIKNLDFAAHGDWITTGGITFYKSGVELENVEISDVIAEDALNIFDSRFLMTNVAIKNTKSDGFDGDFVQGTILNSKFENIAGDGIDFSGSDVKVENSTFNEIGDKAVSAGEKSVLFANQITVKEASVGLASKDGSKVFIKDSSFENIENYALMSYIKKPEYLPAEIQAKKLSLPLLSVLANGESVILLDEDEVEQKNVDIEKLYKSGYMKK